MAEVIKTFNYKGRDYTLEISSVMGAGDYGGSTTFHVYIDKYYQGSIYKREGLWHGLDDFTPSKHHPFIFTEKLFQRIGQLVENDEELKKLI